MRWCWVLLLVACGGDDEETAGQEADAAGGDASADLETWTPICEGDWSPGACVEATVEEHALEAGAHIADGAIDYIALPPASGAHRPSWARWGEYSYLPPHRWLHNLEHGGVALLYHPCASDTLKAGLRDYATSRAVDAGGAFRWVMSPYPDLPSAVAVVTWGWTYSAECVDAEAIEGFVRAHYRQAPEDVEAPGSFSEGHVE